MSTTPTSQPLSQERIEEIKKRADAATEGPWHAGHMSSDESTCNCRFVTSELYCGGICTIDVDNGISSIAEGGNDAPPLEEAKANNLFIAHARQDIPDLLAELDRRQEQTRQVLQGLLKSPDMNFERDESTYQRVVQEYEDAILAAADTLGLTLD